MLQRTASGLLFIVLLAVAGCAVAMAQSAGGIITIAGTSVAAYTGDGGQSRLATLDEPFNTAFDSSGNLYLADSSNNVIRKIDTSGIITTFAGTGTPGFNGDGGQASGAQLSQPRSVSLNASGDFLIADTGNHRVRLVSHVSGVITTVAGTGVQGYSGDGVAATSTQLGSPRWASVDGAGNIYIAEASNHRIRRVDHTTGIISTVAGTGVSGDTGDGGLAVSARIEAPAAIVFDASGNFYFSDELANRIRVVNAASGVITAVAGVSNSAAYTGDGGLATLATLNHPVGLVIDSGGNLLVADAGNNAVRKVDPSGMISTIIGDGTAGYTGDNGLAVSARLSNVQGLTLQGHILYLADSANNVIRRVVLDRPTTTLGTSPVGQASAPVTINFSGITGIPVTYRLSYGTEFAINNGSCVTGLGSGSCAVTFTPLHPGLRQDSLLALDSNGDVLGIEFLNAVGQGPLPVFVPGTISTLFTPLNFANNLTWAVAIDMAGSVFFANVNDNTVRKVDSNGTVSIVAGVPTTPGSNNGSFSGDGGAATAAGLNNPQAVAADGAGNFYISDQDNFRIRRVAANGVITTVAGNGTSGYSGDGSAASGAQLSIVRGLALDPTGNLYIADYSNNVVREIDSLGIIHTVAGIHGQSGHSGDGGAATAAQIGKPYVVAVDGGGNFYIGDAQNCSIRKVNPQGIISTVAGTAGTCGFSGDGGAATVARLSKPSGLSLDPAGNIYFTDEAANRVRKVDTQGNISSIAGSGAYGQGGDGGPATSAPLVSDLNGVVVGPDGALYIADGTIRKVSATSSFTFPATSVGATSAPLTAHLVNLGNADQSMSLLSTTNSEFALGGSSTCSASTPLTNAGAGCLAVMTFAPTATGARTGQLVVTSNLHAALLGMGTGPVNPTPRSFGGITAGASSTPQTVLVTNPGGGPLTITSAIVSGPDAADFTLANSCPGSLAASASCALSLTFNPSTTAAEAATLTVIYVDQTSQQAVSQSIALAGTGVAGPSPGPLPVSGALRFVPVVPCRLADTRLPDGPTGGPSLAAHVPRNFTIGGASNCGVPANAEAFAVNITTVSHMPGTAWSRAWATGQAEPFTSIANTEGLNATANATILQAGTNGAISLLATADMHALIDVTGYFVPDVSQATYHPAAAACRAVDTRLSNGGLGSPALAAGAARTFTLANVCGLPANASAYVLNFTAVPHGPLHYLQAWDASGPQPGTSILNSYQGKTLANGSIVAPNGSGQISVFATDDTDLVIDVEGYFATGAGGLALYTVAPCRTLDTRVTSGQTAFTGDKTVLLAGNTCGIAPNAGAYLFNAVTVPQTGVLDFLTLWSDGVAWPGTSTLNAPQGAATSNIAIVATATGSIQARATNSTHLVLDVYGYFAP